jgi:propanediol dehydratase large subunit
VCRGTPTKNCLGHHLVINLAKDAEQLESLLVVKSTQVSKYFKEAVVKREKIQEHLQHNLEAIKIQMAENRSHLQALQIKMAKEARINRLVPTQQASSFSSIVNDLKKVLQEAKDEIKAADKMLNQVSVIILSFKSSHMGIQ